MADNNDIRNIPPSPDEPGSAPEEKAVNGKKKKKHLIRNAWIRIPLKVIGWIILVVLLIPVLLYVPPVQDLLKDVASDIVYKSTGMKIGIGRFRLSWPVDVNLDNVYVLTAEGDTMVRARSAVADVKLLPLLKLDVKVNRLCLRDGFFRMVNADSSMVLAVKAGTLTLDDRSSANIANSEILLNEAVIKDGDLSLYMNVWKQKPTPPDTTSTPFFIKANSLKLENFRFAMSMLPTIDTLTLSTRALTLSDGVVDLRSNNITASLLRLAKGNFSYIAPTPEFVAAHPAPVDTTSTPSAPISIKADSVGLEGFDVLYATKGVKPAPGFDPSYISVSGLAVGLRDFFNRSSTVILPLTRMEARERSGLNITRGSGTVRIDSTGLNLAGVDIATPWSRIKASAGVPFALMALQPDAPLDASVDASIGLPDAEAFMPDLKTYTAHLPGRNPLTLLLKASGTLSNVSIPRLEAAMRNTFSLQASGKAVNPLDVKKLAGNLDFSASLLNPKFVESIAGNLGVPIPEFQLKGHAKAAPGMNYDADFDLLTPQGDVAGRGHIGLNSEKYHANVAVKNLNAGYFLPGYGLGHITADLSADGAGFDPVNPRAHTSILAHIHDLGYNHKRIADLTARATLADGHFDISASSPDDDANFSIDASGSLAKDLYIVEATADIANLDLMAIGITPTQNRGRGKIYINAKASPERWLYDADLKTSDIHWELPEQTYDIPWPITAKFAAEADNVNLDVNAPSTALSFSSPSGLKRIVDSFTVVAQQAEKQILQRSVSVDSIQHLLPPFTLTANASGNGLLREFLQPANMSLDTVAFRLDNDSIIHGNASVLAFRTGSMRIDTIGATLKERGQLLDYSLHLGNRPGTLDEFAHVNAAGYVGLNRASLYLVQKNIKNETGYRVGLTASVMDSTVSVHFTPLKSTIAYLPWTFNADNHVDLNLHNYHVDADLRARSADGGITLLTQPIGLDGRNQELYLNIENIKVEDFLRMSVFAPPITASVNSELRIRYDDGSFTGKGDIGIRNFTYDRLKVGDLDLALEADLDSTRHSHLLASMLVDKHKALTAKAILLPDTAGLSVDSVGLTLSRFPLKIANAFLGKDVASLGGYLNGRLTMGNDLANPLLNGGLSCDSATVYIPMMGSTLSLLSDSITVKDNLLTLDNFNIYAVNSNPLSINGTVDARSFSDIKLNLSADARNLQLVGNDQRARTDIYGKLFLDLAATVKGSLSVMDINADVDVLSSTDIYYTIPTMASQITQQDAGNVVKFVNFNDTTQVEKADSVSNTMAMRIDAGLTISPGAKVTVNLSTSGTDKVQLTPFGTLNYFQNYMGDMRLNGQLTLGNGFVRYSIPVIGEKLFTFDPSSYVMFNGEPMNPSFNIKATDTMKVNVQQASGNTQLVNFLIHLAVTGDLRQPNLVFDLSTDDDMTIQNELQSMSPDQRSNQAMNLLLYGSYTGPGVKTAAGPGMVSTGTLYSFMASQLNQWAAKYVRGVDLSFGVDQYEATTDGRSSTTTSYSYQVSKSLFDNRFKISVGGNYSTDASADENLSQNLISDISFEYILKQNSVLTMLVKLFRHNGYESILEGEITETGVGFVMRRRMNNFMSMFNFLHPRHKNIPDTAAPRPEPVKNDTTLQSHD